MARKCAVWVGQNKIRLLVSRQDRIELQKKVRSLSNRICYICGEEIPDEKLVTVDHIISKHNGGLDDIKNMAGSCKRCNKDKGNKDIKEYLDYIKDHRNDYPYMTDEKIANLENFVTQFYKR